MQRFALATISCLATLATLAVSQTNPAPSVDRVGFPTDYQNRMKLLYRFDRPDTRQIRTVYGNDPAAAVEAGKGLTYPYGSVLVMEIQAALTDAAGPVLDADGRFRKNPDAVPNIFVMRKERGFGGEYGPNRTGEWEYVGYRPDGTYQTTPQSSSTCAVCHLQAGATPDWTFRTQSLYVNGNSGANVDGVIRDYKFLPGTLRVKAGSTVTFQNDDVVEHTITDQTAGGGDSGPIAAGKSFAVKFTEPGEFNFRCRLHANMTGKVIVER